jgi:tetratricopeptide (TPR) repeat protein
VARYAEAEAIFHELREASSPEGASTFEGEIAAIHERTGRFEEAEQWYRRATDTYPADASRFVLLGAFLARMGRTDEAEAVHRVGTQCEEGPVDEAWLNLGLVQRSRGRYDEAAFSFRQALTRDEGYAEAEAALQDVVEAARLNQT